MNTSKSTGKDDLFLLIKSLSKSEKRYFRIFTDNGKETLYRKIFDIISDQETYSEKALKAALKGHEAVNNFHVIKKYLFDLIMDSLIQFHKDYSVTFKLKRMLQQIEISNSKGLYETTYRLLRKAEKYAREYERVISLSEIYMLQKINLMDLSHKGYTEFDIVKMNTHEKEAFKKMESNAYYRNTMVELFSEYVKWEGIVKPVKNKVFKKIQSDVMFRNENNAISLESEILLYNIKGYYFHEIADYKKSISYRERIITLMERHPNMMKALNRNYIIALHNYITDLRMLGQYSAMNENINKFHHVSVNDLRTEAEQFRRYYIMKSQYLLDTGEFEMIYSLEREFNAALPQYLRIISNTIIRMINYNIARCYFGAGKFEDSIRLFIEIIHEPKNEQDTATYGFSQIWIILAHYELGNFNILSYLSKSALRYFKKHKIMSKIEIRFFEFFMQEKNFDSGLLSENLILLKRFIEKNNNPMVDKELIYTALIDWLNSKLKRQPLKKIIKERIGVIS